MSVQPYNATGYSSEAYNPNAGLGHRKGLAAGAGIFALTTGALSLALVGKALTVTLGVAALAASGAGLAVLAIGILAFVGYCFYTAHLANKERDANTTLQEKVVELTKQTAKLTKDQEASKMKLQKIQTAGFFERMFSSESTPTRSRRRN